MEVASDASPWPVAITTTLVRVIAFVSSQHRSEAKFTRVGGGERKAVPQHCEIIICNTWQDIFPFERIVNIYYFA